MPPKKKHGGASCAAYNCNVNRYNSDPIISLFRFPSDEERCTKWVINSRRGDLDKKSSKELNKNYRMCGKHFEDSQFMNPSVKNKLVWNAVPTIFDVPNPPKLITPQRPLPSKRIMTDASDRPQKKAKPSPAEVTPETPTSHRLSDGESPTQIHLPDKPNHDQSTPTVPDQGRSTIRGHGTPSSLGSPPTPLSSQSSRGSPDTPRKKKLKRKIKKLQTSLWRLRKKSGEAETKKGPMTKKRAKVEHVMSEVQQYLDPTTYQFVQKQVEMAQKKNKGNRWTISDKMMALSIHNQSRKAYKMLSKIFKLPSESTLKRCLKNTNINPGFTDKVFEGLKKKVDGMGENEKKCVLVYDEISLKSGLTYNPATDSIEGYEDFGEAGQTKYVANHALAFMVGGLETKWKQPLAYFLSAGPVSANMLQSLVRRCLDKTAEAGLTVKALVNDQGTNNQSFLRAEGVSPERPYIIHKGQKIFVFFDPPHLLKNVRNNLKKGDLISDGKRIKWQYIEEFYNFDRQAAVRMAPKLTEKHVNLPPFTSMRVNLAAQVLSNTVAAGIDTLVGWEQLPEDAKYTADFVRMMDRLFNCFNSSTLYSSQPYNGAITKTSDHLEFLQECYNKLKDTTTASGKSLPCLKGWLLSISALKGLWFDMVSSGSDRLYTSRLNQDCLENMFGTIRWRGGHRDNPNPLQFRAAFRQVLLEKMAVHSEHTNCIPDNDDVLLSLSHLMSASPGMERSVPISPEDAILKAADVLLVATPPASLPVQSVTAYIAGYILRKIPIVCTECKELLTASSIPPEARYDFMKNKMYCSSISGLIVPSVAFANYVQNLETIFVGIFPHITHMKSILLRLCKHAEHLSEAAPTCDTLGCKLKFSAMVRLYMKVRIFHALKMSNIQNMQSHGKRNRKVLKLMNV